MRKKTTASAKKPAAKKTSTKSTRTSKRKAMTGEEVYAMVMGPSGKHLYQLKQKTQKELDGLDMKNPSPQAVARAAKGLSELLDTFINCITIRALLANLEAAAKTAAGSLSPGEILEINMQIARAKAWIEANCKART